MRLKKLEIYGFKSFAERTIMEFGEGITGVVGPNGSGKSNIGDAVRWVLGEQSARSLRGAKMEDVIFGGTLNRRALNFCEVTLVFDNEDKTLPIDYAEVQVTRRVYRSGDSEYMLNKSPCRLKDIVDLFRDTGIGREGYSLIGQGRIDEILSIKSEDRRSVFEEAAGITKFKARRQEAERRMENTAQNLERVGDILQEVGAKLPTLEAQSKAARSYTQLMAESRLLEANVFLRRYDALSCAIEQLNAQLAACREQQQALQAEREALQESCSAKEERLSLLDQTLSRLNGELVELTRLSQMYSGESDLLVERIQTQQKEMDRLHSEDVASSSRLNSLQAAETERNGALQTLNKEHDRSRQQIHALESLKNKQEAELQALEEKAEQAKSEMIASFNRLTDVKAVSARLTATRESLENQSLRLEEELKKLNLSLDAANRDCQMAKDTQRAVDARLQSVRDELQRAAHAAAQLSSALEREEASGQRVAGALREAMSRLKMLEQMRRDYDGYQNSVRELLRRFSSDPGLCGVVASLLTVPKELERAVEMALGGATQNIVCQREEDAKRMIDTLRKERLGRATFLPVSAVRGRSLSAREREVLSMPGCIGVASELISYEEQYRPIFENLLGRTVLARDLDSGIAIMRKGGHAFRLVTLDGDVMHSGGSMTGGSLQARTTSLLSREREILEYRQAVARLEDRSDQSRQCCADLREQIKENNAVQDAFSAKLHDLDLEALRESSKLAAAEETRAAAKDALINLLSEKERMQDSLSDIQAEFDALSRQTDHAQAVSATTQADIAAFNEQLRSMRESLEETHRMLAEEGARLAAAAARRDAMKKEQERLAGDGEQLRRAFEIRQRAREALQKQLAEDEISLTRARSALSEAAASLQERTLTQRQTANSRALLQQELRQIAEKLEDLLQLLETQRDLDRTLEARLNRSADERKLVTDRLWERHELTYESALELKSEEFDEKGAVRRIEEIRAAIRKLGTVNLSAMQEYEELRERFDALSSQKIDLEKAQRDLSSIIRDLTREMETRFISRFSLINQHFGVIFARLFGGGTALLKLQDEDDCLNCGIDIVAQPPGKKLQLLSLLSGGERALTAIALLFSMLAIRPSPFCILDEIEAALDENNVDGFADYLHNYSRNTQFIVISHRKGTMERCDRLYGVAMEEKGISRMVSVQLEDVAKEIEEA